MMAWITVFGVKEIWEFQIDALIVTMAFNSTNHISTIVTLSKRKLNRKSLQKYILMSKKRSIKSKIISTNKFRNLKRPSTVQREFLPK